MLNAGIHAAFSTNCIAEVLVSKPMTSGIATIKPASAPVNASQRASGAFLSEPVASTTTPARMGTQMTRESMESMGQFSRANQVTRANTPISMAKA